MTAQTPATTDAPSVPAARTPLSWDALRGRLTGRLALPGQPGYELAIPWNVAVPVQPQAVVAAADAEDVAAVVRFARSHGLTVAVQRTGHGAVPLDASSVMVHTGALDEVSVDVEGRWARVGAGATWQQVLDAATPHGLAPLCGSAPGIGVAGFLTGGGLGPIARSVGVSSDHVRAVEVVTGEGRLRRATPTEHRELFWGLRGGKGTLGVVTAVEIDLLPIAELVGGCLWFDGADAAAVTEAWRRLCEALPEEGTTSLAFAQLPPLPQLPPQIAGRLTVAVRFAWLGEPAHAEELLAPLLAAATPVLGGVGPMPYSAIGSIHADPVDPMPVHEQVSLLRELPAEAVSALVAAAGPGSGSLQTIVEVRHLGGAVAREPQRRSAFCHRDTAFTVLAIGVPVPDPGAVAADASRVLASLAPWTTGARFPNFGASADPAEVARAYDPETLRWLGMLAEQYDPAGVLRVGAVVRTQAHTG